MERSFMKKTMNIFFCALLGAAVLIGGCSDNNKAEAVKENCCCGTERCQPFRCP